MALIAASLARAADRPPSTDDQLRDSLNSKDSDDYDRELLGDPAKNPSENRTGLGPVKRPLGGSRAGSKPQGKDRVDEEMLKELQKELGPAAQKEVEPKTPLQQVADAMREVPQRLDQRDSGEVTQTLQRQIVSDLDKLIEAAKKSGCCNCTKSGGKPTGNGKSKPGNPGGGPSKSLAPAKVSTPEIRKAEEIRAAEVARAHERMVERFRAELQGHKGEQMLAEPGETFLPEYELEIEDYFRRLSEDRPDTGGR